MEPACKCKCRWNHISRDWMIEKDNTKRMGLLAIAFRLRAFGNLWRSQHLNKRKYL